MSLYEGWSSPSRTFFNLRFGLVADQGAVLVFLSVDALHHLMAFRPGGHLDKAESLGLAGKLIDNEFSADDTAKLTTKFGEFGFGDIIR